VISALGCRDLGLGGTAHTSMIRPSHDLQSRREGSHTLPGGMKKSMVEGNPERTVLSLAAYERSRVLFRTSERNESR
jgi:hypothetical protein